MFRRRAAQDLGNSSEGISAHVYVSPLLQSVFNTGYDVNYVQVENATNASNGLHQQEEERCIGIENAASETKNKVFEPKNINCVSNTKTIGPNNDNDKHNLNSSRNTILQNQSENDRYMESSESTLMRSYCLAPSLSLSSLSTSSLCANTSPLVSARMPMPHSSWAQRRCSLTYWQNGIIVFCLLNSFLALLFAWMMHREFYVFTSAALRFNWSLDKKITQFVLAAVYYLFTAFVCAFYNKLYLWLHKIKAALCHGIKKLLLFILLCLHQICVCLRSCSKHVRLCKSCTSHVDNCERDYKYCYVISWKNTLRQTTKKKIVLGKIVSKVKNFCFAKKNTNIINNSKNNDVNTSNNNYSSSIKNKDSKIAKHWYRAIAVLRSKIDSTYRAWRGTTEEKANSVATKEEASTRLFNMNRVTHANACGVDNSIHTSTNYSNINRKSLHKVKFRRDKNYNSPVKGNASLSSQWISKDVATIV